MLQTSHTIYVGVLPYIYSTSRFSIHYPTQRSLQPLRNLSPNAFASLRHLTFHLNVASCEASRLCYNTFHLVCDVCTLEAAQLVLAFLFTAPPLPSCAIRLAQKPDPTPLQTRARDTATTITTPIPPSSYARNSVSTSSPSQALSLLQEIQHSTTRAYHIHYSTWCCGKEDCPPHLPSACSRRNCWLRAQRKIRCFYVIVYVVFWTEYRCWRLPAPIFLVSMGMRDLAKEVGFWWE